MSEGSTLTAAGVVAGLSQEEKRAFYLEMLASPEFVAIQKDKVLIEDTRKKNAAAAEQVAMAARLALSGELTSKVSGLFNPYADRMLGCGLLGYEVTVSVVDGLATLGVKPIVKTVKAASAGHASGGAASTTSVKALLGAGPDDLFKKYATEGEVAYERSISGFDGGSPQYIFKRSVFVPRAIADGTISATDDSDDGKRMRRYSQTVTKSWTDNGVDGVFNAKKGQTFAEVARLAAIERASKPAK